MENPDNLIEPAPNVGLGLVVAVALSVGLWGLIYLGVASVWSRLVDHSVIAVDGENVPHSASLVDKPRAQLPTQTRVKATRKRRRGPHLAARVFRPSTSVN
jgi:hypothetical protein